ncbi:hypothetical protein GmHk_01G001318 [Glycine max]|nr:hypothetical protein GmHk_01G001318 [Glycine max]
MPSSFADLVFARERIKVGLKRRKFNYVYSTSANGRRIGATGAKRKEGDTHAVTSTPAWVKPPQISHGTHQYVQHHPSFSACAGDSSNSAPVQPRAPAPVQREVPQALVSTMTRPTNNAHLGVGSNAARNFPPRPTQEFAPIPMTYKDLLPSLIANQMPLFPRWYNPNATCAYHGGTPGHLTEQCMAFKRKVQKDWPNVKTNPLANHGGGAVNAIELSRLRRSKPLRDEALQKGGVIPRGGHEKDSCLMHPGVPHSMETGLAVEDLLQQMIDQGRLEVGDEGDEEQHICMQSADEEGLRKPKPLVIHFTRDTAPQTPRHPSVVGPIPFPYKNSHAVPWRYAPPTERKEGAIDISSLSTKVTNITGLSGMTRSGHVFALPDLPMQPANAKGKARMTEGQNVKVTPAPDEDVPMKGLFEGREGCDKKEVSLEEAGEFLRIIQQIEFKVIEQLNKTLTRVSLLELLMSSEPHRALLNKGKGPRLGQQAKEASPCHINRSFISVGLRREGQVAAICEDDSPRRSDLFPTRKLASGGTPRHLHDELNEMAPKKLSTKRSRRDATGEGSSATLEFDSHRFQSAEHQRRFEAIRGWSFHRERRVQLREDEYTDFQEEIARRRWTPLVTPMAKFDPEIVLEFYANA